MPDAAVAPDLPVAEIEHRIPGRLRLRLRAQRGDTPFFQRAETGLARLPDVRRVSANPLTGSILIEHGGADDAPVLAAARDQGLFTAAAPPPSQALAVRILAPSSSEPGPAAVPSSPLDLAAIGFAAAGLLQLARGQVVGSASENMWNAYGLYVVTRQAMPSIMLVAFGLLQIARGEVLGSATSLFLYAFSARRMAQHRRAQGAI